MTEFQVLEPNSKVYGQAIQIFSKGFPMEVEPIGTAILEQHGIQHPESTKEYPMEQFLDAMKEVHDRFGSPLLRMIGEQVASTAILPPDLDSLEKCLASVDIAYHMNHSGENIGYYQYVDEGIHKGMRKAKMECGNPYGCHFDYGLIEGFAKRFKPHGCKEVIVQHDDSKPCRKTGGDSCTYILTW